MLWQRIFQDATLRCPPALGCFVLVEEAPSPDILHDYIHETGVIQHTSARALLNLAKSFPAIEKIM